VLLVFEWNKSSKFGARRHGGTRVKSVNVISSFWIDGCCVQCCCPAALELLLAFSWFPMLSTCCPTKEKGPTPLAFNKNLHHLMLSTKSCTTSCWISNKTQCNDDFNFQRPAHHLKLQPHHDLDWVAHSIFSSIQCWLLLQFNVRFSLMHLCVFFFRT
jgi:hypothetical protein